MSDTTSGNSSPPYFETKKTEGTTTILRVTPNDRKWRTFLHAYKLFQEQVERRDRSHFETRPIVGEEFYRTIKKYLSEIGLPSINHVPIDSATALDDGEIVVTAPSYQIQDKQGEGGLIFRRLIFTEPAESEIKVVGSISKSPRNSEGNTLDILFDILTSRRPEDFPLTYRESNVNEDNENRRYIEISPIEKIPSVCKALKDTCENLEEKTLTDLKFLYEGKRRTNGRAEEILVREYRDMLSKIPFNVA